VVTGLRVTVPDGLVGEEVVTTGLLVGDPGARGDTVGSAVGLEVSGTVGLLVGDPGVIGKVVGLVVGAGKLSVGFFVGSWDLGVAGLFVGAAVGLELSGTVGLLVGDPGTTGLIVVTLVGS